MAGKDIDFKMIAFLYNLFEKRGLSKREVNARTGYSDVNFKHYISATLFKNVCDTLNRFYRPLNDEEQKEADELLQEKLSGMKFFTVMNAFKSMSQVKREFVLKKLIQKYLQS